MRSDRLLIASDISLPFFFFFSFDTDSCISNGDSLFNCDSKSIEYFGSSFVSA